MSKYSINDTTLDNIAAPIMSMRGLTGGLTPEEMGTNANAVMANVTDALAAIAAKGVDISGMNSDNLAALIEALATLPTLTTPGAAADLRTGKQLIDGSGNIITGTMPEQAAQTITPGTSNKTIASGRYLTGTQTIKGDSNLVAANIASGKTIFGVKGTFVGGKMVNGSFTPSSYSGVSHTITHSLGAIPNFACIMAGDATAPDVVDDFVFHVFYNGTNWLCMSSAEYSWPYIAVSQSTTPITYTMSNGLGSATTSKIVFRATRLAMAGATLYYWIGVI